MVEIDAVSPCVVLVQYSSVDVPIETEKKRCRTSRRRMK